MCFTLPSHSPSLKEVRVGAQVETEEETMPTCLDLAQTRVGSSLSIISQDHLSQTWVQASLIQEIPEAFVLSDAQVVSS